MLVSVDVIHIDSTVGLKAKECASSMPVSEDVIHIVRKQKHWN